ncbi:MAG: hypothetical protein S0880_25830 [Actinomycetota bacterium]|nr:hypothetical protein [Actinomycetota bacterium]
MGTHARRRLIAMDVTAAAVGATAVSVTDVAGLAPSPAADTIFGGVAGFVVWGAIWIGCRRHDTDATDADPPTLSMVLSLGLVRLIDACATDADRALLQWVAERSAPQLRSVLAWLDEQHLMDVSHRDRLLFEASIESIADATDAGEVHEARARMVAVCHRYLRLNEVTRETAERIGRFPTGGPTVDRGSGDGSDDAEATAVDPEPAEPTPRR